MHTNNVPARTPSRQSLPLSRTLRPGAIFEPRERGFGTGYGASSGYASDRSYLPEVATRRFRIS